MQTLADRLRTARFDPRPARPVRVAMVITDLDVGGAERALVNLATQLDRGRWEPSVIALGGEGELAVELRRAGIDCECLGGSPRRPFAVVARLIRALRRRRPELVQSFLFHANLAARLAAPFAGRPWVIGGLRVAEREKGWHLTLDRITGWLAAGSVCVSEGVRRFSVQAGRLDPRRLTVIPNGIDPRPYDVAAAVPRSELGIPDHAFLAIQVGRLTLQKGLAPLLDAAERVIPDCPDWHLALAGDGPDRGWLLDRIAGSEVLNGRIHWLGPRRDVPDLLATADLLVLASLWEGMPNVVLEAMAARRAVVATAVEGTDELVIPGETGWLVPPDDPPALAAALGEAARDPATCRALGLAGRARVEREFSIRRVVRDYEGLWSGVLGYRDGSP
ncbi:glycosyltransferase [Aquisphaera insulae]|uniref:glycosyltransferase n=1 Tax=Aquisphaera insulae TaxID=2712864 RepID=UPI0013ECCBBC|nr:glycosyltransferase [Aquisphaera insulae]